MTRQANHSVVSLVQLVLAPDRNCLLISGLTQIPFLVITFVSWSDGVFRLIKKCHFILCYWICLIYGRFIGLRPSEVCESVRLLNSFQPMCSSKDQDTGRTTYYNWERQTLEHFRFPEIFLRKTKKAYISFVTLDNLKPIAKMGPRTPGYNSIRLACQRRGINMNMHLCRRVFASWLRKDGI